MEDVERAILIKIPILKAKLKNFSAEDVDENCINVEEIAVSEYEEKLEDIKSILLEIAADIIGLLREYNARMQTQRKEWWEAQMDGIIDEFKAHKRQVKAAVRRAKGNLMDSSSNSLGSQESNASEVARDKEKKVLSKIKGLEEGAIESNDKELQEKNDDVNEMENSEGVEKVIPKETEDIRLFKYDDKLDDTHNDENLARKEDYEVVEKVKDNLDNVQLSEFKENDENCGKPKETEEVRLIKCKDKPIEIPNDEFKDKEIS